ncbi:MAG TPA: hypothetical protein VKB94_07045, partial [Rhizomicrobium sp.]|nr:hypothetical protein [Rhizomicrobium sp.]
MQISRRKLISSSASVLAAATFLPRVQAALADPQEPDLIVYNARVHTVDASRPKAQAFAMRAGRFVAVGGNDIKGLAGKKTQTLDAKGMMIVPGFIDTHNHAGLDKGGEGLLYNVLVGNPYDVELVSIASIIAKLKA